MSSPADRSSAGAPRRHDHAHHEDDHHHGPEHQLGHGILARVRGLVHHEHSHDTTDAVDAALESSARGIRAVKIGLVALGATALLQAVLVAVTGSVALLADTIHNFSDALTALPLWVAFALSRRPANSRYTYGFGRAEDLAGVFIVAMVALSALVAGWESVRRLVDPQPLTQGWVVVAAGLIGFAGNELVAVYRVRVGRQIGSAALVADGQHARADGFTSLAVVLGALGSLAGFPLADPVVGLLITVAILFVLKGAVTEVYRRLMDAVDPGLTETALAALAGTPGVLRVDEVRLRWVGHRIIAEAGVSVAADLDVVAAHHIAHDAEDRLVRAVGKVSGATIHVGPVAERCARIG